MRPGQDQSDLNGKIWQKLDELSRGQQQLASSVAAIKAQKPSLRQFPSNTSRDSTRQNVICFHCNKRGHYARDFLTTATAEPSNKRRFPGPVFPLWGLGSSSCSMPRPKSREPGKLLEAEGRGQLPSAIPLAGQTSNQQFSLDNSPLVSATITQGPQSRIEIKGEVGSQKCTWLLDTGAQISVLSADLAQKPGG